MRFRGGCDGGGEGCCCCYFEVKGKWDYYENRIWFLIIIKCPNVLYGYG